MKVNKQNRLRRIIKIFSVVSLIVIASLFMLRSVYAISVFQGLTGEMERSGWRSTGADSVMQTDEELTFEVSYLFFKIGAVSFQVLGKTVYDGVPAYRLRAHIDSYSGIPFVNLHAVYETYADAKSFACLFTSNSQKEGDGWIYTSYHFDLAKKTVDWEQSQNGKLIKKVTYPLDKNYTDGLSFFYYLREVSREANGRKMNLKIPIVVDTIRSSVELTINEKREACDVTAYDFPLESYRMSGHINFTGFFGVTGDFTGWMSADTAEIPLRANVKVLLGSVVVKLKDVKRNDWVPPRSKNQ